MLQQRCLQDEEALLKLWRENCCRERFCDWCMPGPAMCGAYEFEDERQAIYAPWSSIRALPGKRPSAEHDLLFNPVSPRFPCTASPCHFPCRDTAANALQRRAGAGPSKEEQQQQILTLVKEVQIQQAQIVANQANTTPSSQTWPRLCTPREFFSSRVANDELL